MMDTRMLHVYSFYSKDLKRSKVLDKYANPSRQPKIQQQLYVFLKWNGLVLRVCLLYLSSQSPFMDSHTFKHKHFFFCA